MVVSESHTAVPILIGRLKRLQLKYTSPPEDYRFLSESVKGKSPLYAVNVFEKATCNISFKKKKKKSGCFGLYSNAFAPLAQTRNAWEQGGE